jgi:hypothetical protein
MDQQDGGPPMEFWLQRISTSKDRKDETNVHVDPEDLIALGGVLVALVFAVAM